MKNLDIKAFGSLLALTLVMALLLFATAGTVSYWQAWAFLAVYVTASVAITLYLRRHDPALLERRMRGGPTAEKSAAQRFIMLLASSGFIGLLVVPALDRRFGWSQMPEAISLAGDAAVALGWLAIFRVFKENTYTSATIEIADDQKVITTGPYGLVRHPMYSGAFIMLAGIPLALGSWWGCLVLIAILPAVIWRLLDEENFLALNLPGYTAYQQTTRYRLIPGVW
jgi:protein-S-isoprenylcysteine O-methyltransferase Ste14